jgi:hypothetical protein
MPMSCEREFSSLQGEVSVTLQPSSAVFLLCKRDFFPTHMTRTIWCSDCHLLPSYQTIFDMLAFLRGLSYVICQIKCIMQFDTCL